MNAISFTQTRSTLSTADLRISESLAKPLQIMNVEASEHSPSVTISIFDALAEILTSTPRTPRLSTTTAVTPNQNNNDKQTLNGVSNSITVNSQDPLTTFADVKAFTKSVQTTEQTTNVINNLPFGETATPSLNTERATARPVNTPPPIPISTTPLSARKPFAIKVLYSGTDTSTDKSTASDSTSSDKPSTDSPKTVFNKVSDLLLTNNNLVSSELTSMLSSNINNIIQNMDKTTRSKISVDDMAKLLRTLIPRALDLTNVNDDTNIPETTPYSLEDINDTANIKVGAETVRDSNTSSTLQAVTADDSVNRAQSDIFSTLEILDTPSQAVNNTSSSQGAESSTLPVSSSQMTSVGTTPTTVNLAISVSSTTTPIPTTLASVVSTTSSGSVDTETVNVNRQSGVSLQDITNTNVPLPFFTNSKVVDFIPSDTVNTGDTSTTQIQPLSLITKSVSSSETPNNVQPQDPSQVSPMEFWVLSKKARVLKMIEDLIRQHNDEIATIPPLIELLNQSNNIPLSNRLTEIINTMTSTTASTAAVNIDDISSTTTIPTISPFPLFTTLVPQTDSSTNGTPENGRTTVVTTTENIATIDDVLKTISRFDADLSSRFGTGSTTASTETDAIASTTPAVTSQETVEVSSRDQQDTTQTTQTTFQENTETTTDISNTETTQNIDTTTTTTDFRVETLASVENTTRASQNETKQNLVSVVSNQFTVSNQPPKKDYVIFGILPNNTVVRKDPNDDILETITESSPYIIYGVLPNNTIIRRFPNGTRVPRVMQRVEVLPISPWSLRNPYSPIHNNPAIVRPQSNPIRVSTNIVTSTESSNNGTENLTNDTVNNQQPMVLTLSSLA